jgi:CRISPR-associated protein Cas6
MQLEPTPVELRWPVFGDRVQLDCRYRLYSALVAKIPELKSMVYQLGGFTGTKDGAFLKLGRSSELIIRCRVPDIAAFAVLDNQIIEVGQSLIRLGELTGSEVEPSESLTCDLVIIKLMESTRLEKVKFAISLGKQLFQLGIDVVPDVGDRGVLAIKGQQIIGYPVYFDRLSPRESITLQSLGLGGKRRMGCGVLLKY